MLSLARNGGLVIKDAWRGFMDVLTPNWRWTSLLIGTACLFLASKLASPGNGFLTQRQGIESFVLCIGAFTAFWVASRPRQPLWLIDLGAQVPGWVRWRGWSMILVIFLIINTQLELKAHYKDLLTGHYHTDAISFVHMDADLLLHGQNPYTIDSAYWQAIERWPTSLATPMLGGTHFGANPLNYPTKTNMASLLNYEALNPLARSNDFDPATVHNYPAGIILLAAPFVWAGLSSVIWLNLIVLIAMIALILIRAPRRDWSTITLAVLISPVFINSVLFINFDLDALFLVMLAWHFMPKSRMSPLFMGVACAVKQTAWFIAPFYLLEVYRREGAIPALRRAGWMAAGFFVPNLPFIIASPGAWLHSILVPMLDPMFPMGYGAITLMLGRDVPLLSPHVWMALVLLTMGGLLYFMWKRPAISPEGIFLGLVPLWFSWRSLMNYFAVIPFLVAWVAVAQMLAARQAEEAERATLPELPIAPTMPPEILAPAEPERELAGVR
jgi:hypothetical protein